MKKFNKINTTNKVMLLGYTAILAVLVIKGFMK